MFDWAATLWDPSSWASRYWIVLGLWAVAYVLAVWPSAHVYDAKDMDRNPLRPFAQFFATVLLPWAAFLILTDVPWNELRVLAYPICAAIIFVLARFFTAYVADHGPDAQAGDDFRFWVRILREGETLHLLKELRRSHSLMVISAITAFIIVATFFSFGWWAFNMGAAARTNAQVVPIAEIGGVLFTGVACTAFIVSVFASQLALGMQSVSFPVRYGVAANSLQVFLSATWAAAYPWFVFGESSHGIGAEQKFYIAVAIFLVYLVFVVWPIASWRTRFRETRAHRLVEFRRIVLRIQAACMPAADGIDKTAHAEYQEASMRKAHTALAHTLRSIVSGSPFRAFTMLHINAPTKENRNRLELPPADLPWYRELWNKLRRRDNPPVEREHQDDVLSAHAAVAMDALKARGAKVAETAAAINKRHGPPRRREDMDGYQLLVNEWVEEEAKAALDGKSPSEDSRVLSALVIANPQLKKMVTRYRYGIERTDYRYRLMYWTARFLSRLDKDGGKGVKNASYLYPLAHETLADLDHLAEQRDVKASVLTIGGGIFSLLLAFGQGMGARMVQFFVENVAWP